MNIESEEFQAQSKVEKKRCRIDVLETDVENVIKALEQVKQEDPGLIVVYKDYLNWCFSVLNSKSKKITKGQKEEIENKIEIYKREISELTVSYNRSFDSTFTKQPIIGYGNFLQTGIKLYIQNVDAFKVMNVDEIFYLAYSKKPSIASYSFIAILARYTLPKNNPLYAELYHTIIDKIKQALPQAYANPSHDNITGLLFLTFISLSHFNTAACTRYFSLAVRMAQCLGYDKMAMEPEEVLGINEMCSLLVKKGIKIWNSISTIYCLLTAFIPNFPLLRIKLKPTGSNLVILDSPKENNGSSPSGCCCKSSSPSSSCPIRSLEYENILMQSQGEILSHIQNVKLEKLNKVNTEQIFPEELRLPLDKFNIVASNLIRSDLNKRSPGIQAELVIHNDFNNLSRHLNNSKANLFAYQWNCFRQATIIALYYPSVLVFPRAVKFPFDEAIILLEAAGFIKDYYVTIDNIKKNNPHLLPEASISCLAHNDGFGRTYYCPYYMQLMYALYVYLCFICEFEWLSLQGFADDKQVYCESQILFIINFLKDVSRSSIPNERKDALKTLEYIESASNNFSIPEPFNSTFKSMFF